MADYNHIPDSHRHLSKAGHVGPSGHRIGWECAASRQNDIDSVHLSRVGGPKKDDRGQEPGISGLVGVATDPSLEVKARCWAFRRSKSSLHRASGIRSGRTSILQERKAHVAEQLITIQPEDEK